LVPIREPVLTGALRRRATSECDARLGIPALHCLIDVASL